MKILFIGNFAVYFTTENERAWSFEQLGHEVIKLQENKITSEQIMSYIDQVDLLVYSHTHDPAYIIPGLIDVFERYKEKAVPTISVHLDKWAGLERQKDMGNEATWSTEYIFMADASDEAVKEYERLGLNWYWLKPGVVLRECYKAEPDKERFPHDIVFVGSKGYHPEYPWRPQMIEWLRETYGYSFGHYGNDGIEVVRGSDLNVLYASAKIVVGDSCFAGETKNYWSDRIPETTGRGGFLIHPYVVGCDHMGVEWFAPKDFKSLQSHIDYYLANEEKRERLRGSGMLWTMTNRTYTHLAQEILDTVFPEKAINWKHIQAPYE